MKVFLDNNVPKMLRKVLKGHVVQHSFDLGWADIPDASLLPLAEQNGFDVLVTSDKSMKSELNHAKRKIALVVLESNRRKLILGAHDRVRTAVERSTAGSFTEVDLTGKQAQTSHD